MALTDAIALSMGKAKQAENVSKFAVAETFGLKKCDVSYNEITLYALILDAFEENTGNLNKEDRNCLKFQLEKRLQ